MKWRASVPNVGRGWPTLPSPFAQPHKEVCFDFGPPDLVILTTRNSHGKAQLEITRKTTHSGNMKTSDCLGSKRFASNGRKASVRCPSSLVDEDLNTRLRVCSTGNETHVEYYNVLNISLCGQFSVTIVLDQLNTANMTR